MTQFPIHTLDTAPAESRPSLEGAKQAFGGIPNLLGIFAESPAVLQGYLELGQLLDNSTDLTATEKEVVLLSTSFENDCEYCMAAHSAIAGMEKVPADVVQSLREGSPLSDPKLEALRRFTLSVVRERGWVSKADLDEFMAAGYSRRQVLEVILGVSFKTLSNFTNHISETPLDSSFSRFSWSKPSLAGNP